MKISYKKYLKKNNLWLITELFPPEETSTSYIFGEIANVLADKYQVNVICGPEIYDYNKKRDTNNPFIFNEGIRVLRVKGITENKNNTFSRVKKFLLMSNRLYKIAKQNIKEGDKVLMATNPFPLIIPMGRLRRNRNFELNVLVHDVFPEPLEFRMKLPSFVYSVLYRMFGKAYASADLLISLGRDMTELLRSKTAAYNPSLRIEQIENWGDVESIKRQDRSPSIPADKLVIQYAGNIGEAQGVQEFINHVNAIRNNHLLFSIWGTGSEENKIKDYVDKNNLNEYVEFNGPYFRSQQSNVLNRCDMALVSLRNKILGIGVPSKTYNILAAGKPILFVGPLKSEIAQMIQENDIGYCFDEFDYDGIEQFISSLSSDNIMDFQTKGIKARKLAEKKYSKEIILNRFKELI